MWDKQHLKYAKQKLTFDTVQSLYCSPNNIISYFRKNVKQNFAYKLFGAKSQSNLLMAKIA